MTTKVLDTLVERWQQHLICEPKYGYRGNIDVIFYTGFKESTQLPLIQQYLSEVGCFKSVQHIYANTSEAPKLLRKLYQYQE